MQNEQRIKEEMFETRAALAEKLVTLEQKVAGTVDQVTSVVSDTMGIIEETVDEAKETAHVVNETVQESVKSVQKSLDVSAHVQAHPWAAVIGSVAAGACLGIMLKPRAGTKTDGWTVNGGSHLPRRVENGPDGTAATGEPGMWTPEIKKLKGLALGVLFGTVREMVAASLPEPVNQQIKDIFDGATQKVGGKPIPSSAFAGLMQPRPRPTRPQRTSPRNEWNKNIPPDLL